MKTCNECKIEKEYDKFYIDSRAIDNHTGKCKACRKAVDQATRTTPEFRAKQKIYDNNPINKARIKARKETPEYKAKNKTYRKSEEFKEWNKEREAKPEIRGKRLAFKAKRRAQKTSATLEGFDEEIEEIYKNSPKGNHVHHIIPLQEYKNIVSGLHVPWNLVSLTKEEHLKAHADLASGSCELK
jgi:hypothetical protein